MRELPNEWTSCTIEFDDAIQRKLMISTFMKVKWDGYRIIAFMNNGVVKLQSRDGEGRRRPDEQAFDRENGCPEKPASLNPEDFTIHTIGDRLAKKRDLFAPALGRKYARTNDKRIKHFL